MPSREQAYFTSSCFHGSGTDTGVPNAFSRPERLSDFDRLFPDNVSCKRFLLHRRWPDGPACPRCGNANIQAVNTRPFHWVCKSDAHARRGYTFCLYVGSVFEHTRYHLRTWFRVLYLLLGSKSARAVQLHRMTSGCSGRGRRRMQSCIRQVRAALADPAFRKLMGIEDVELRPRSGTHHNRRRR